MTIEDIRKVVIEIVENSPPTPKRVVVDQLALAIALCDPLVTEKGRRQLTLKDFTWEEAEGYRRAARVVMALR